MNVFFLILFYLGEKELLLAKKANLVYSNVLFVYIEEWSCKG